MEKYTIDKLIKDLERKIDWFTNSNWSKQPKMVIAYKDCLDLVKKLEQS